MDRVTSKLAPVSGAARGQGRSHARMLAAEDAHTSSSPTPGYAR